jgi:hypothetical protein
MPGPASDEAARTRSLFISDFENVSAHIRLDTRA